MADPAQFRSRRDTPPRLGCATIVQCGVGVDGGHSFLSQYSCRADAGNLPRHHGPPPCGGVPPSPDLSPLAGRARPERRGTRSSGERAGRWPVASPRRRSPTRRQAPPSRRAADGGAGAARGSRRREGGGPVMGCPSVRLIGGIRPRPAASHWRPTASRAELTSARGGYRAGSPRTAGEWAALAAEPPLFSVGVRAVGQTRWTRAASGRVLDGRSKRSKGGASCRPT